MEWATKNLPFAAATGVAVYLLFLVAKRVAVPVDAAFAIPANLHAMVPFTLVAASLLGLLWITPRRFLEAEAAASRLMPTRTLLALAGAFVLAEAAMVAYAVVHPRTGSGPSIALGLATLYCLARVILRIRQTRKSAI